MWLQAVSSQFQRSNTQVAVMVVEQSNLRTTADTQEQVEAIVTRLLQEHGVIPTLRLPALSPGSVPNE